MLTRNSVDDVVLALAEAPIDPRTGNRVLYSVDWVADVPTMIGKVNEDWVRRELAWFESGSNNLADMEEPVPTIFESIAGVDGTVNSAYGHILFSRAVSDNLDTLYERVLSSFITEGLGTRHAVAIISDRNFHTLARHLDRKDWICTNALNFMIDAENRLHIMAQMRSMDAVFGYRADWSMWDRVMERLLQDLSLREGPNVTRGDITFQVANLHVYPRHLDLLEAVALDTEERIQRRVWQAPVSVKGLDS